EMAGLWGEAVRQRKPIIVNDYDEPNPCKLGLPEGHIKLKRLVSVPAIDNNRIVAVLAAGNKKTPYDDLDVQQLRLLTEGMWHITQRRRAEQTLARLTTAIEQAQETVMIFGADGFIQYVNPALEKQVQYTRDELIGKDTADLGAGPLKEEQYREIWEKINKGESWSGDIISSRKDGSQFIADINITPVYDEAGNITCFASIGRDITKEQQLEDQLRQSQKMEAIGTLSGGIAHDFNNILGGIIGYSEVAKDDLAEGLPVDGYIDDILQLGLRAKNLTQQILTFSRKNVEESGPMQLQPVVKECLKMLRATIPKTIEIQQVVNPQCGSVVANAVQMHQLVMNLCTNAADEMLESGGELEVRLEETNISTPFTSYDFNVTPGQYVCLSVRDTGLGIPPENLERIFEPFFTSKEKGKGTGLGLAVVYGIVQSHEGALTVKSTPGQGTEIKVLLPNAHVNVQPVFEETKDAPLLKGTERVLLVDDEKTIIEVTQRLLSKIGYDVTAVKSSPQALALFKDDPEAYDIVITDQTMPKMTGFQLAQELLRLRPDVPVILCTGYSETVTEQKATQAGVKALLMKPLKKEQITKTIRTVLDQNKS
ncbi:ATP-binding protein, partial [Thermodesulfobacteriota bacterium]